MLSAILSPKHRAKARSYLEEFRKREPSEADTVVSLNDAYLEGAVLYDLGDAKEARIVFERGLKRARPDDLEQQPRLALAVADLHVALGELELEAGRNRAGLKHGDKARALCERIRRTDTQPHLEQTEWGTFQSPESPNAKAARECEGEVYALEAWVHTQNNRRSKAVAAVQACLSRLVVDGFYSPDAEPTCSEFAAHWALQGDNVDEARAAAKRHIKVLDELPGDSLQSRHDRAEIYAALGEFEARKGSPKDARQYLLRARDDAKAAAADGRPDPALQKRVADQLKALDAG